MPHDSATQLARAPLLLLDYAEQKGLDREELMRLAGIRPQDVQDPDSRIRTASMRRLWRAVDDAQLGAAIVGVEPDHARAPRFDSIEGELAARVGVGLAGGERR